MMKLETVVLLLRVVMPLLATTVQAAPQPLAASGVLLGWTPLVRNKVRGQARKGLEHYLRKQA